VAWCHVITSDYQGGTLTIQEYDAIDNSREKVSLWNLTIDILAHNNLCYLLDDDVARLKEFDEDYFYSDAESLLSEVTTLVCLANVKVKERKTEEDKNGSSNCGSSEGRHSPSSGKF